MIQEPGLVDPSGKIDNHGLVDKPRFILNNPSGKIDKPGLVDPSGKIDKPGLVDPSN